MAVAATTLATSDREAPGAAAGSVADGSAPSRRVGQGRWLIAGVGPEKLVPGLTISSIRSSSVSVEGHVDGADLAVQMLLGAGTDDGRGDGRMLEDEGQRHVDEA